MITEQLRTAITAYPKSVRHLAEQSGVDPGQISRFMSGERDLTLSTVERLCNTLNMRFTKARKTTRK